ncbi:MAG TPA: 5'-nucleotidase C-terminal domain-containing protein [Thermoanaerobaculia bacterium]|nr:5'-nucleotidase C-terminal domain-containing protein [Thermoanaerobaculia bacterium]
MSLLFVCAAAQARTARVTLLHFSDYHSHALPFYSEGRERQGGIARAIGYLRAQKQQHGALVFSGGDMMNKGSPAWSDKYRCAEWPWFNGVVDAMAFGNHDPDYGIGELEGCLQTIRYPVLSANTNGFHGTRVFMANGIRVGVFAIAGSDFKTLVKEPLFHFGDPILAARDAVRELREKQADVIVLIGHEQLDDDFALARAVPGIDLIFGTHSHLKRPLMRIEGTRTWFISPFQYLTYISRVVLTFDGHKLTNVAGELIPVDGRMPVDKTVARRVAAMQRELEADPKYAPLFATIGTLTAPLPVDALAQRTVEIMRDAAHADVALSTASSFRQDLPSGRVTMESLRAAMPYDNEILVYSLRGDAVEKLLAYGKSRQGSDSFAIVAKPKAIDQAGMYRVATTDYLARVAPGYRDFFAGLTPETPGLRVRDELRKRIGQ